MDEVTCQTVCERIALGEGGGDRRIEEHLRSCEACRREAERIAELIDLVAASAEIDLPERLDRSVRSRLSEPRTDPSPVLRPAWALTLGIAAVVVGIVTVVGWVDALGGDVEAVRKTLAVGWFYFVFATVATLPLLIYHRVRGKPCLEEVVE